MEEPVRRRLPPPRSGPHAALPLRAVLGDGELPYSARWLCPCRLRADCVGRVAQVLGDLSPHKCRAALDSVVFAEEAWQEDSGSVLADIVAHLGQDVSILQSPPIFPLLLCGAYLVSSGSMECV